MNTRIAVTNLGAYNEGQLIFEWLDLPFTQEQYQLTLDRIGIDGIRYEEWFISDYECDFLHIGEYDDIQTLNELVEAIDDNETVKAIIEHEGWHYWQRDIEGLLEHVEEVFFIEDLDTHEELGYWLADNGYISIPDELQYYFDYEKYGRDFDLNSLGGFVTGGYLLM